MRTLTRVAILGATLLTGTAAFSTEIPVDLELVLAIDVSGSIDADEAALQRRGYLDALLNPDVLKAIKGGFLGRIAVLYMEWAGPEHRSVITDWTLIDGPGAARSFVERLGGTFPTRGLYTSIRGAIDYAIPLFDGNGFEGTRRVIDVSGDGPNNTGGLVTVARDAAVARQITINGLPIVNDRGTPFGGPPMPNLDLYYRDCVIGGSRAFLVVAESFESFAEAIRRKLLIEIADLDPARMPDAVPAARNETPRIWKAADGRWVPPCTEGERLLEQRRRGFRDY